MEVFIAAHCKVTLLWISVRIIFVLHKSVSQKPRQNKDAESVSDEYDFTDKTSRCAFRTSILHRPSSLPITKDCLKHGALFYFGDEGIFPWVCVPKKPNTTILIDEYEIG